MAFADLPVEWPMNIEPEPRVPGGTPWNVDARWLLYSADHREWMLEEDFLHPGGSVRPRKSFTCMFSLLKAIRPFEFGLLFPHYAFFDR